MNRRLLTPKSVESRITLLLVTPYGYQQKIYPLKMGPEIGDYTQSSVDPSKLYTELMR